VSRVTCRVSPFADCAWRIVPCLLLLASCLLLSTACRFPGSVKPTIKIGLSAPFEGLYRDLGYEVLHAVRLAVRQRNQAGGVAGEYLVELVAHNDFNEPEEAALQAREMAVDPGVLAVLGGLSPEAARTAAPAYRRLGLVFLAPETDLTGSEPPASPAPPFAEDYQILSGGVPPGPAAVWAYATANRLLDAMAVAARAEKTPTRAGVQAALANDLD
jgi:ABC-type branched-subunit amino acid transport system substrate-binding protein